MVLGLKDRSHLGQACSLAQFGFWCTLFAKWNCLPWSTFTLCVPLCHTKIILFQQYEGSSWISDPPGRVFGSCPLVSYAMLWWLPGELYSFRSVGFLHSSNNKKYQGDRVTLVHKAKNSKVILGCLVTLEVGREGMRHVTYTKQM